MAAEAQVSISTVSLVMNEKGNVSAGTRDRVLTSARRLGYVPTQAARHLASRRTGNVGFVVREDHFTRSEPFYTRIFLGTEFEARNKNLYVLLTTIPSGYTPGEHTPRFLREYNVDGLIVAGKVDDDFIDEAEVMGTPLVFVDFEVEGRPAVVIDNQSGARAATEHLFDTGRKRVAFLGADLPHPSISARLDGFRLAHAARGLTPHPDLIVCAENDDPTRRTGRRLAEHVFELEPRPDAVFCANDALALGVLEAAAHARLSIPQDMAVFGFDDVPEAAQARPPLSTVRVFKEQLGELAIRYIVDLIEGSAREARFERGGHTVKVKTELVIRDSG